jgi:hypothetical protein
MQPYLDLCRILIWPALILFIDDVARNEVQILEVSTEKIVLSFVSKLKEMEQQKPGR